jgi:GLPGLI family protein
MSIKNIIYLLLFLLSPLITFAQKKDSSVIEVKYYAKFLQDTLNISSVKEDILSLRIGENRSIFRSDRTQKSDSLTHNILEKAFKSSISGDKSAPDLSAVIKPQFIQEVFYDNGKTLVYDKIRTNTFAFQPANKISWVLSNENKIISGYHCKKATCRYGNKDITAWYTSEIPFQEGPYTFKGLPGLIVSIEDSKQYYSFLLKELKRVKKPIVPKHGAIETTFEKFNAKRQEVKNDPVGTFNQTVNTPLSKSAEQRVIQNNKSKNNHLD